MKQTTRASVTLGKAIQRVAALRGGGSALPGLVVEKLNRHFLREMLSDLPDGVVVISGTNGKTTTTKIVSDLLAMHGKTVLTNNSGSNFTRGVIASVLRSVDKTGHLPHDIAVLELDEAHAVHFIREIRPRYALILNVMRDQLDRFGEIDTTARLLAQLAHAVQQGIVLNRNDERVASLAHDLDSDVRVEYFGVDRSLQELFVQDDDLHAEKSPIPPKSAAYQPRRGDVELASIDEQKFPHELTYRIGSHRYQTTTKLSGVYNYLNVAGALALCRMVLPVEKVPNDQLVSSIAAIGPAFGRGEIFTIESNTIEMVLVKNPAGFRLALSSVSSFTARDTDTMIVINDTYADGRDMSWLWDVDFSSLGSTGSVACVSGQRAYDMALRLQYDGVEVSLVEPDIAVALEHFIHNSDQPKRIFCTYSAMLQVRRLLSKLSHQKHAL